METSGFTTSSAITPCTKPWLRVARKQVPFALQSQATACSQRPVHLIVVPGPACPVHVTHGSPAAFHAAWFTHYPPSNTSLQTSRSSCAFLGLDSARCTCPMMSSRMQGTRPIRITPPLTLCFTLALNLSYPTQSARPARPSSPHPPMISLDLLQPPSP